MAQETYTKVMDACEKAGQWQVVLSMKNDMAEAGPSSYLMDACEKLRQKQVSLPPP